MKETLIKFLETYLNTFNSFFVISGIMLFLLILYIIISFCGGNSLRKINKVLRKEDGDEIIRKIESLRLSKRFAKMWDDYYIAYTKEDTVSLSSYLVKNDLYKGRNLFRLLSRTTLVSGFAFTVIGIIKIPGLFEAEKLNVYCLLLALIAIEFFLEIFYTLFEDLRRKRLSRLMEEFEVLSLRKLPGKAVSFEQRHVINKLSALYEELNNLRSTINQVNARMDRQYNLLNKNGENK